MDAYEIANSGTQQIVTKDKLPEGQLVVQQTIIRPIDRQVKDIEYWRQGHISAERVVFPNRVRLYDLYLDAILDGHLSGIIEKRIASVLNKTMHYYNGKESKVDKMDLLIECGEFRRLIREIMLKDAWGLTGLEFVPGKDFKFLNINRKHIKPEAGIIAKEQYGTEGFDYDTLPLVWVIGQKDDYGFLLKCAPYALYKRGTMADWSQFSEIFGMPIRVAKYDANDTKTRLELNQVLNSAGSALVLMIPKQADFEIIDGKMSNATGEVYQNFKKCCDDEMSIIVLGNTETTQSSKSSGYAQGQIHQQQQLEITKSDLKDVENCLNSDKFFNILKSYGYPVEEGGKFKYEEEINIGELATRILIDVQVALQVPIGDDYWYETYGIDKPDNYDELKTQFDAKKQAQQQPLLPIPGNNTPQKTKPQKTPENVKFSDDPVLILKWWDKMRLKLADFFEQAHND